MNDQGKERIVEKLILRPKPLKGDDHHRIISVRMKEEMVAALEQISAQSGYSRNKLIQIFLAYALEHYELSKESIDS